MNASLERLTKRFKDRDPSGLRVVSATAKAVTASEDGNIRVIATTPGVDMDGEVVLPRGYHPESYFLTNRSVFVDHMTDEPNFIGKIRRGYPRATDRGVEILFRVRDNDRGRQLLKDDAMFGTSVSIGFDVIKAGAPTGAEIEEYGGGVPFSRIIREWEWLETSVTYGPCNVQARSPHPDEVAKKSRTVVPASIPTKPKLTPYGLIVTR